MHQRRSLRVDEGGFTIRIYIIINIDTVKWLDVNGALQFCTYSSFDRSNIKLPREIAWNLFENNV